MTRTLIDNYQSQLAAIFDGSPWIDETFKKKIDGLTDEEAFARPYPAIHSVAELVSHLVGWRKVIMDSLKGLPYESIFEAELNWRSNDTLRQTGWKKIKDGFYYSQQELNSLLEKQNDAWLGKIYSEGKNIKYLVDGLLHHDLYHLGQIGITLKLVKL